MKKILLIVGLIVIVAGYLLWNKSQEKSMVTTNKAVATPTSTPAPSHTAGMYKDGTYTSDAVPTDRGYGTVQIKLVVIGGKITDIQFVQFPNTPGHTTEVSDMALPILKQETIAAQSASVDTVTGATQTADAFKTAVASALALAK